MTAAAGGIWRAPYLWVSVGGVSLVFLSAMETLAVTTVMPVIAADLGGRSLYALAFAGTLAASVIGMVITGSWADARGPAAPLSAAVALFVAGLLAAGLAPTMALLVVGRLLQGLGTGGVTVALYVVVGRAYPSPLHGRILAAYAAAWVVPSLVGPFVAGAVAEALHWRWVFLGVAVLSAAAYGLLLPRLGQPALRERASGPRDPVSRRLGWSIGVATAVVALSLAGGAGRSAPLVVVVAAALVAVTIRPLLPAGTLRARRGLPSVILLRGAIAAAFFSAEIYVPYLFIEQYGFSPTWAGLALTGAAVLWAAGSELQGRVVGRWNTRRLVVAGLSTLVFSVALVAAGALVHAPAAVIIAAWSIAGAGMGVLYPRTTVLMLAYSTPADQGLHSAALSIAEAAAAATAIAAVGVLVGFLGAGSVGFVSAFALATALAAAAFVPGLRTDDPVRTTRLDPSPR